MQIIGPFRYNDYMGEPITAELAEFLDGWSHTPDMPTIRQCRISTFQMIAFHDSRH